MTTIACSSEEMAADGRAVRGDMIVASGSVKVWRTGDGALIGAAGTAGLYPLLTEWWERGPDRGKFEHGKELDTLILQPDGVCLFVGECGWPTVQELPTAIGSGAEYAIAAMGAKASPAEAVAIACEHDPWSGGKIIVLSL